MNVNQVATQTQRKRGLISLYDWNGFDTSGANDNQAILAAAHAQGLTAGYGIEVPATKKTGGGILIGSTVPSEVPMIGVASGYYNYGAGRVSSKFLSGITDGTPVFSYTITGGGAAETRDGFHIENIAVHGSFSGVAGGAQSCVGFRFGEIDGDLANGGIATALSHGTLDNVQVWGCATGVEMQGWVQTIRRYIAAYCNLGFRGQYLNASDLDLSFEGCGQGMVIDRSYCMFFGRYLDENSPTYRVASSKIDSCMNIVMATVYLETPTPVSYPWIEVGSTTKCYDFNILSLLTPNASPTASHAPIKIYRCDGYSVPANDSSGVAARSYTSSARYSQNDKSPAPRYEYSAPTTDHRWGMQHQALDLVPNPYCEGLRFGCEDAFSSGGGVVITEDTSIFRTGTRAMRITSVVGDTNCGVLLRFYDDWAKRNQALDGDANADHPLTFGAWVWVPDLPGMQYPEDADPKWLPSIGIIRYDAVGSASSGDIQFSPNLHVKKGAWNFMHTCLRGDPSTTIDSIAIGFWPQLMNTANAPAAPDTPYIVVDSYHLAWGDCWQDMFEGRIAPSSLASGRVINGRLEMRKTQAQVASMIADTNQVYRTGDTMYYTDPASAGSPGKVCTTGGAGGTALWAALPVMGTAATS